MGPRLPEWRHSDPCYTCPKVLETAKHSSNAVYSSARFSPLANVHIAAIQVTDETG